MSTVTNDREIEIDLIKGGNVSIKLIVPDSLTILDDPAAVPPKGSGCMRVMSRKHGDKRVVWDSRDFAQISDAKTMFDNAVAEGLVPYRVGVNGRASSEVMVEFDPYAEEVIFLPISMLAAG